HSVAKLLAANEQLHKEKEHLKQTYKEHYDTIKKTRVQNKDNSDSLISQINQKSVENADLKAQIQEKVFANAALKNELRKLKGNIVDSKFAKASILGKPPLQPSRNHLVVRQPNAFTSERPRMSRPRFASQVDEKNDLSKTVTPHYLPKVRESAAAKPHQVNAPNYSRNSHKESYGSNDMVHAYFLEDARKMTQDKTRIPNHRDMASTRAHCTPNACTPKPRNIYRSSPVSKCSGGMSNGEPLVDHSRNSSFFLDSKQFVCSICHKYIFNTNHDDCITKILNKVNSRAKVQSPKIRNNNPVEPKNHTHKPGRQIGIGQRFSLNKSSAVHEKPHTLIGIHCISKFPSIYIQLFWERRSLLHDNIVPKPDLALELGKSISLTEAEEEAVAREVHATHARILSESEPEPTQRRQKSNLLFNAQKIQKNPIFQISVDILNNTNFFRAFTASASVPAIYIKALAITPVIPAHPFVLPPSGNTVIDFVNELGYPEPVEIVSNIRQKQYHSTPDSAVHHTGDDFILGNLKLSQKVRTDEVILRKPHKKVQREQPATKRALPKKEPTQTTNPVKPSKPAPAPTKKPSKHKLPQKVRKGKPTSQLVDEDDEAQQESVPQEEGDDPDLELAKKMILDAHQEKGEGRAPVGGVTIRDPVSETTPKLPEVVGKGKAIVTEEQVAHSLIDLSKKKRNTDQFILVRQAAAPKGDKDQGEVDSSRVTSGVSIPVSTQAHEALAGPDPEPMQEDQTGSDSGKVHVSLAGPNPEHMDDEFLGHSLHQQIPFYLHSARSLLHDNIVPKPDLALELGKSISLTEAEEEAVAREVHATHARIKRSSDSSKKLKGIQTLTPAEQEAADIMKALKESKKISKRQPGTRGSNEGTGNILGVPDESTIVSRASSEGTGSKPGVPDEEKLILEWEADVDSEHFDRDDNAGDDNEETGAGDDNADPAEIYK
ncbi:hypothetical protein Tco_0812677, partial [Tanacetum coccineum]